MANINLLRKNIDQVDTLEPQKREMICDLLRWKKGPTEQRKTHSRYILRNDNNT